MLKSSMPKSSMPIAMISTPAAAYPFPTNTSSVNYRPFRPFIAPTDVSAGGQNGTRYVWGNDINGNGVQDDPTERNDIFPNIPPRPGPSGEIPMLPGNLARPIDNTNNEHMTNGLPGTANKALWYRTAGNPGNWPGEGDNINYNTNNLFINNLSFPRIGGGAGSLRPNLNSTGSLVLPNTACINLTNGFVDQRCALGNYTFGSNTITPPTGTTLLNLNLPHNPHFPSDNTGAANTTSATQPATSFVVCGGNGNTRRYQAIERSNVGRTDITSGSCSQTVNSAGEAIRNFMGDTTTLSGSLPNLSGGTGLRSARLDPANNGVSADKFVGLIPNDEANSLGVESAPVDLQKEINKGTIKFEAIAATDIFRATVDTTGATFSNGQTVTLYTDSNDVQLPRFSTSFTSADTITDLITVANNPFTAGNAVVFSGAGTPPAPLTAGTTYFVREISGNTFKLALAANGNAIDLTSAGSGALTLTSRLQTGVTYYVREAAAVNGATGTQDFKLATSPTATAAIDLLDNAPGIGHLRFGLNLGLRAVNTYADNRVQVYNLSNIGTFLGDTRTLSGTITLRANCTTTDPVTGVASPSTCSPTSDRRGPSPVFILRGDANENYVFNSLQVRLDGVDPNNVFWVFPRVEPNYNFTAVAGTGVITAIGSNYPDNKPILLSGTTLPGGLSAGTTYYVRKIPPTVPLVGAAFQLATSPDGLIPSFSSAGSGTLTVGDEANVTFQGNVFSPNIITGNFIGTMPSSGSSTNNTTELAVKDKFSSFRGVRFLGFRTTGTEINNETLFVAMTAVDQPALLPVLQLSVPNATAASTNISQPDPGTTAGINGTPQTTGTGQWTIRPTRTEVNVYFVAGSTPSRKGVAYTTSSTIPIGVASDAIVQTAETGGGLANFVRFLENWENVPVKIAGGFIQNTKSRFATGPYTPSMVTSDVADTTTIFMNPLQTGKGSTSGLIFSGYNLQYMSKTVNRIPYYSAPIRLWGYDVGLLTQQPDRFAERFAVPIPGSNEFFREISGDDQWVESLLCALEPNDPTALTVAGTGAVNVGRAQREGTTPTNYVRRALRGTDRRAVCDTLPYGATTATDTVPATLYE